MANIATTPATYEATVSFVESNLIFRWRVAVKQTSYAGIGRSQDEGYVYVGHRASRESALKLAATMLAKAKQLNADRIPVVIK